MNRIDATKPAFVVGDILVYPAQGLMKFEGTEERQGEIFLRLKTVDGRMTIGVPMDRAQELVRRPVPRAEAERLLGVLRDRTGQPDERPAAYRLRDGQRTLVRGSFEEQVRGLQRWYLTRFRLSFGERKLIGTFETATVDELAHVLGLDKQALIDELHGSCPGFAENAPVRPSEPPLERPTPKSPIELNEHEYLGEFQVTGGLIVVGEWTQSTGNQRADAKERSSFLAPALNGTWHAFIKGGDDANGLVAVHGDHVQKFKKVAQEARELSRVVVEGGGMTMVDGAVRDDSAYIDEAMFPLFTVGLIHDRGCHCRTGGDGVFAVSGVRKGSDLIFVEVNFE
ncbi:MAG: hypothetical protein JXR83_12690 [Deltaproteobacteria bacterium]|nr:hypothetical protein [Deltaproteobacteria bacterium]